MRNAAISAATAEATKDACPEDGEKITEDDLQLGDEGEEEEHEDGDEAIQSLAKTSHDTISEPIEKMVQFLLKCQKTKLPIQVLE